MAELIGQLHVVPMIWPADITTNATNTDVIFLKQYNHATILIQTGTNTVGCTLTVQSCDDATPSTGTAIAFNCREMATSDTWGDLTAYTTSGVTIAATDDNHVFAIEIDADELSGTNPAVRACLSAPVSGNNLFSAIALLSEPRRILDTPATAIA